MREVRNPAVCRTGEVRCASRLDGDDAAPGSGFGRQPNAGNDHPSASRMMAFISGVNVARQSPATPLRKNEPLLHAPAVRPPASAANKVRATQAATMSSRPETPGSRNSRAAAGSGAASSASVRHHRAIAGVLFGQRQCPPRAMLHRRQCAANECDLGRPASPGSAAGRGKKCQAELSTSRGSRTMQMSSQWETAASTEEQEHVLRRLSPIARNSWR